MNILSEISRLVNDLPSVIGLPNNFLHEPSFWQAIVAVVLAILAFEAGINPPKRRPVKFACRTLIIILALASCVLVFKQDRSPQLHLDSMAETLTSHDALVTSDYLSWSIVNDGKVGLDNVCIELELECEENPFDHIDGTWETNYVEGGGMVFTHWEATAKVGTINVGRREYTGRLYFATNGVWTGSNLVYMTIGVSTKDTAPQYEHHWLMPADMMSKNWILNTFTNEHDLRVISSFRRDGEQIRDELFGPRPEYEFRIYPPRHNW